MHSPKYRIPVPSFFFINNKNKLPIKLKKKRRTRINQHGKREIDNLFIYFNFVVVDYVSTISDAPNIKQIFWEN